MSQPQSINGRLARRLSAYVILTSTLFTLITSSVQIYLEYQRDMNNVYAGLDQIENTQLSNLAARVWYVNQDELQATLNNLLNVPSVRHVAVYENRNLLATAGSDLEENLITRNYALKLSIDDELKNLGSLVIQYSLSEVYQHIIDRAVIIVTSNGIKTFIVAGFIMFIFYHLVARHLIKIADYAQNSNLHHLSHAFDFDREPNSSNKLDELDLLNHALSNMKMRLGNAIVDLQAREKTLETILNSIDDAVIATDIHSNIIRMNPRAEEMTGWAFSNTKDHTLEDIFHIVDTTTRSKIITPVDEVISTGKHIDYENNFTLVSRNDTEYQISNKIAPLNDSEGITHGAVLVFSDLTEKVNLRHQTVTLKLDMESIMDNSSAVIYIKDTRGHFTFINKQFESIFNIKRKDIIGKKLHDIFPKEIADNMQLNDRKVIESRHAIESEERVTQDDGLHSYISTKFPMFNEAGEVYEIGGISTDITKLKLQEEKIHRSLKMDSLGKLTGGIAHDYNNILGVVRGYAELLISELNDIKLQSYAEKICTASDRAANLTQKLLSFSRKNLTDPVTLNLNNALKDQQDLLEKTMTVRIKLNLDFDESLWPVFLDESEFEDAVLNLSINAMHSIEGNGSLTIKTRNINSHQIKSKLIDLTHGDYVSISFIDSGCGIDTDELNKIFDPFYSTKGELGTGLGLSQVYGFIIKSGGSINVISTPNKGSEFVLYFPRHSEKNQTEDDTTASHNNTDLQGHETILVVDDEPDLLQYTCEVLTKNGYSTFSASSAEQALEILTKQSVDLLISDILMPDMDGYELANIVTRKYPSIKIQLASGYSDHQQITDDEKLLSKKILQKPYQSDNLLIKIRDLLDS